MNTWSQMSQLPRRQSSYRHLLKDLPSADHRRNALPYRKYLIIRDEVGGFSSQRHQQKVQRLARSCSSNSGNRYRLNENCVNYSSSPFIQVPLREAGRNNWGRGNSWEGVSWSPNRIILMSKKLQKRWKNLCLKKMTIWNWHMLLFRITQLTSTF